MRLPPCNRAPELATWVPETKHMQGDGAAFRQARSGAGSTVRPDHKAAEQRRARARPPAPGSWVRRESGTCAHASPQEGWHRTRGFSLSIWPLRDVPRFSFHGRGVRLGSHVTKERQRLWAPGSESRSRRSLVPAAGPPCRGRQRAQARLGAGDPGGALGTRSGPPSRCTQHSGAHRASLRSWLKMCMFNHRNLFLSVKIVR